MTPRRRPETATVKSRQAPLPAGQRDAGRLRVARRPDLLVGARMDGPAEVVRERPLAAGRPRRRRPEQRRSLRARCRHLPAGTPSRSSARGWGPGQPLGVARTQPAAAKCPARSGSRCAARRWARSEKVTRATRLPYASFSSTHLDRALDCTTNDRVPDLVLRSRRQTAARAARARPVRCSGRWCSCRTAKRIGPSIGREPTRHRTRERLRACGGPAGHLSAG